MYSDFLVLYIRIFLIRWSAGALIGKKAGSTDTALPARSIRDSFLA